MSSHTRFLCILHVKNVVGILLTNIVRKKQYITIFPHPLPSLKCVTSRSNMITAAHVKYSNCIRYNFFIYCPICMKFSHNILHTYSFILNTIKHNWKIRRFWVVDPLKLFNFVINFLVAQEKLPGKLQARAIISTRRGWILIAWTFIARNFLPSVCSTFIEGGCGTLSIHLLSFLKGSEHYFNSCLFCSVYKVVISIRTTNTAWSNLFIIL